MTKPQLPNLQQTFANTTLIINSNNLNNFWVDILTHRVTSIKSTKRYGVSQSESLTRVANDRTRVR